MSEFVLTLASALWLGVVTSVSPCPLATNVAAVSVLAGKVGNRRRAFAGALAYSLGRMAVYVVLALVITVGIASMPQLSHFLRREILPLVGPFLILAGMVTLGWLPLPFNLRMGNAGTANRIAGWGLAGEFSLGAIFALSFCPLSAALFFGSLMPVALASPLPSAPVALYGLGTALPVGIIAMLLVFSSEQAARALDRIQAFQKYAVAATGWVLIGVGVWLTLTNTLSVL